MHIIMHLLPFDSLACAVHTKTLRRNCYFKLCMLFRWVQTVLISVCLLYRVMQLHEFNHVKLNCKKTMIIITGPDYFCFERWSKLDKSEIKMVLLNDGSLVSIFLF